MTLLILQLVNPDTPPSTTLHSRLHLIGERPGAGPSKRERGREAVTGLPHNGLVKNAANGIILVCMKRDARRIEVIMY
jgi:hypothetical protein